MRSKSSKPLAPTIPLYTFYSTLQLFFRDRETSSFIFAGKTKPPFPALNWVSTTIGYMITLTSLAPEVISCVFNPAARSLWGFAPKIEYFCDLSQKYTLQTPKGASKCVKLRIFLSKLPKDPQQQR
ncbi:MAG: hypothetical protein LBC62_05985, partial [Treponema sp.]|nr:hypothetical protein [Treponema sp.]